ncbi:hypothetical protein MSAN_00342900 [Mycena sanguinolenta]|uniref:Uncharacterized protein n=1 Tax=Mycena sanguinolenta TaxID=230812 RepID=A0A8H6Z8N8_9AGAR|nr:hypothetical protein MSAN_00342900 [Mycena sanguinolenta]
MSLEESTSRAEALCTQRAEIPGMNSFQPIAVSAVEVCRAATAANLVGSHTARIEKLAAHVVDETEKVINGLEMAPLPPSEDTVRILDRVEIKLDGIRRAIEHMFMPSKKGTLFKNHSFDREIRPLKKELKALVDGFLKGTHTAKGISRTQLTRLTIRAASAICEAPALNFLKPVVGIAEIIAETAQTVKSNRSAALQLAVYSSVVTRSIVERAATLGMDGSPADSEALVAIKSVLENIQLYLTGLQKPHPFMRHRVTSWISAN